MFYIVAVSGVPLRYILFIHQARATESPDSNAVAELPFACLLTVTDKQGGRVKISSPGEYYESFTSEVRDTHEQLPVSKGGRGSKHGCQTNTTTTKRYGIFRFDPIHDDEAVLTSTDT